jgi:hypothetical protein
MHTLQDFLLVTKAETYLIAVAFLVIFPLFWRWLNGRSNHRQAVGQDGLRRSRPVTRPGD